MKTEIPLDHPSVARQIRQKQRLKEQQNTKRAFASSSLSSTLPAGQHPVNRWIVLDLGLRPPSSYFDKEWSLEFSFEKGSYRLTMRDVEMLKSQQQLSDWHCVTGWSATNLPFQGIPFKTLMQHEPIKNLFLSNSNWKWLYCESADGYTAPICRDDLDGETTMLAMSYDGKPLCREHGGPRLLLPNLYGWKSAKWVVQWKFLNEYQPGFWERLGCHSRGRHALEERFDARHSRIWKWIAATPGLYRWAFGNQVWVWVMQQGGSLLGKIVRLLFPSLYQSPKSLGLSQRKRDVVKGD